MFYFRQEEGGGKEAGTRTKQVRERRGRERRKREREKEGKKEEKKISSVSSLPAKPQGSHFSPDFSARGRKHSPSGRSEIAEFKNQAG